MGTKENMLVQDVYTCWNSTDAMLSRLQKQRWPVTAALSDPAVTQRGKRYLDLKTDQWSLIEEMNQVLEPFNSAHCIWVDNNMSHCLHFHILCTKLKIKLRNPDLESPPVKSFQAHPTEQVTERWKDWVQTWISKYHLAVLACSPSIQCQKHSTNHGGTWCQRASEAHCKWKWSIQHSRGLATSSTCGKMTTSLLDLRTRWGAAVKWSGTGGG